MKIILHRLNTIEALQAAPANYGVEADVRSWGEELILHHDSFVPGQNFAEWLSLYRHGTLIVNVKEEGLEERLIALLRKHDISDYFFLDQSFPFLVKWANAGERRCAARVSEYESVDAALSLAGKIDWVWVDCFTRFPLPREDAMRLHKAGFKLCLVSPELQGRNPDTEIPALRALLADSGIFAEAVCTKRPDLWRE
jgi:hypothetical protein